MVNGCTPLCQAVRISVSKLVIMITNYFRVVSRDESFPCTECKECFETLQQRNLHIDDSHPVQKKRQQRKNLEVVPNEEIDANPEAMRNDELDLVHEDSRSEESSKREYTCQRCWMVFLRAEEWHTHVRAEHGRPIMEKKKVEKPYACTDSWCGENFRTIVSLKLHEKLVHPKVISSDQELAEEACHKCQRKFCTLQELKVHLKKHTEEKEKSRRLSYSYETKHKAITKVDDGVSMSSVATEFGVDPSMVSRWCGEERSKIVVSVEEGKGNHKSRGSGRKASMPEMESLLAEKIKAKRDKGMRVRTDWVKRTAKSLALKKNPGFKASPNWLRSFRRRKNLTRRRITNTNPKSTEDRLTSLLEFHRSLRVWKKSQSEDLVYGISPDSHWNVDQLAQSLHMTTG